MNGTCVLCLIPQIALQNKMDGPAGEAELLSKCFEQSRQHATQLTDYIQKQLESVSYKIDKIIDLRKEKDGSLSYNVRWVAHTWIPANVLSPYQELIRKFLEEKGSSNNLDSLINLSEEVVEEGDQNPVNEKATVDFVTVASNSEVEKLVVGSDADYMKCPRCYQQFYLKSNLEVHMLFCKKNQEDSEICRETTVGNCGDIPVLQQLESNHATATEAPNPNDVSSEVQSVRDALKISQTFEYIPLGSNDKETHCKSCQLRFPNGSKLGHIKACDLLMNATKKVFSDQTEVFECSECHRDYLFKHPFAGDRTKEDHGVVIQTQTVSEKPHKCSVCCRGFQTQDELHKHEIKHSNIFNRYSCSKCNEKFPTRVLLQSHYESANNTCTPHKCVICEKEFVHANHLRRHMTIHAGIKPYPCQLCAHEFNQKSDLKRHEKRHDVDGKLACLRCALMFDYPNELKEHSRTHRTPKNSDQANEWPKQKYFKCERCEKVFGRKSHYTRHLSIHNGLKPHACTECGKSFNQRTDLKRHSLTHTRKKLKNSGITSLTSSSSTNYFSEIMKDVTTISNNACVSIAAEINGLSSSLVPLNNSTTAPTAQPVLVRSSSASSAPRSYTCAVQKNELTT